MIYVTLAVLWRKEAKVETEKPIRIYYRGPEDDVCIRVMALEIERDRLWKCFEG